MKNNQVKQMIKSVRRDRLTPEKAVHDSLLAGGGAARCRKPALVCWVAQTPYYEGPNFIGWGNFTKVHVHENINGKIHFRTEDGHTITVNHCQVPYRVRVDSKRPDTGTLDKIAAQRARDRLI